MGLPFGGSELMLAREVFTCPLSRTLGVSYGARRSKDAAIRAAFSGKTHAESDSGTTPFVLSREYEKGRFGPSCTAILFDGSASGPACGLRRARFRAVRVSGDRSLRVRLAFLELSDFCYLAGQGPARYRYAPYRHTHCPHFIFSGPISKRLQRSVPASSRKLPAEITK